MNDGMHPLSRALERGRTNYTANRKGYHLIIDHVPAWICRKCGEALFDEETVEAIQAMLREVDRQEALVNFISQ